MDVLIIYFSQTGNTEKVAQLIQKGILKSGNTCKIEKMKTVNLDDLSKFDLIGIGTPTFFYREPVNVRDFIRNWPIFNKKNYFLFCTHGSMIGNTFYYMREELNKKGFTFIGAFDTYANTSLQFYPKLMHTAGHPDHIDLKEAEEFGENICEHSLKVQKGEKSLAHDFEKITNTWWAHESERLTLQVLKSISPKFKINTEKCTQCFTCQDNCPVDAINVEITPPEIQKEGCIYCWNCQKSCPVGAIEADWSVMEKISKKNLLRYIDILKEAEEKGTFRPHVDYKNIY